jgi:hypothetical protein
MDKTEFTKEEKKILEKIEELNIKAKIKLDRIEKLLNESEKIQDT